MKTIDYNELLNLARTAALYAKRRGYYYGIHMWCIMINNWFEKNDCKLDDIPPDIIDQIKDLHLMYSEYFNELQ